MSATSDTSQSPIGPCGPSEQSPFGDSLRHASTALLSSALDCGENTGVVVVVVVHTARAIDPRDPVNMFILLACLSVPHIFFQEYKKNLDI